MGWARQCAGRQRAGSWLGALGTVLFAVLALSSAGGEEPLPFFPSAQTTPDGKQIALTDYPSNADCCHCHAEIARQWRGSMHAQALADPIFRALYEIGSKETGGATDRLCAGCHSSPAVLSGVSAPAEIYKLPAPANEGVSCVVCHSTIRSNKDFQHAPANGSFISNPKGPIVTPHPNRPCQQNGRDSITNLEMRKSEFCANCHGVIHPQNGFVIERTYEEWKSSIYAARGIECQDCHMQPVEKAIQTAKTLRRVANPGKVTGDSPRRSHTFSHTFVGGNATVTALLGSTEHARMATQLLQGAASLQIDLPKQARPGALVPFKVKVNNETAGHNLPTSLVEVRQMWLDIQITDAAGKTVFRSGAVDPNGDVDPDAVMFHALAVDEAGAVTVKPWEMTRFIYFHTVPPRGYTLERYAFVAPADVKGPLTVKAMLRYRSAPQALAKALLGPSAPTLPIIDMTSATAALPIQ